MSISFTCSCGRSCRVKDAFAGRQVRCPDCRKVLRVPAAEEEVVEAEAIDVLEEAPDEDQDVRIKKREEVRRPRPSREDREEEREREEVRRPRTSREEPEEEEESPRSRESRPRKKFRKRPERQPRVAFEEGWFGSVNAGAIGGVLMMLIAVGWFVAGLAFDRIFIYPPILFAIGFIAMIKGMFSGG
jgi:hypothetical protein